MAESSAIPTLPGLAVETVEWLPSGAESGLVRVRGRWVDDAARQAELPTLALRTAAVEHRFDSLPDARFSRDPASWRGTYLVPASVVASEPEAMWLEWGGGTRSGLPSLARGIEPPPVAGPAAAPSREDTGGEVIDRAVLAERRARRAEAAEREQARVAAEALKAVEVLELRSAELERRLEEATAERDALAAREAEADERRGALSAALASAAELRSRSREWQLRMRTHEVARAGDAVRLAVLEAERATTAPSLRAALDEAKDAAVAARRSLSEIDTRFADARAAWDRRREELEAELRETRGALEQARGFEARLQVETVARTTLEDELDRERALRADLRRELAGSDDLRAELEAARAEAATVPDLRAELEAARAEAATVPDLRAELEAARADLQAARAEAATIPDLRSELEAARADLEAARAEAATIPELRAELERRAQSGREELERLAREQAEAAAAREPAPETTQLVADLDAAAEALRAREPASQPVVERSEPISEGEPAAPDAEPAVEWAETVESERRAVAPGVEPRRDGQPDADVDWAPAAFPHEPVDVEPPAPDAEPYVEWTPPETETPPAAVETPEPAIAAVTPDEPAAAVEPPEPADAAVEPEEPAEVAAVESEPPAAVAPVVAPAGPRIVSATGPPARGLMLGTDRRDYPLLRGALVKLAHDDPDLAGRLLAALLPAQGAALDGPLGYDITIRGTGTYGVAIAGGRAGVEALDVPRSRHVADFHLTADPLVLAELLAGVDHRIGRFFGPVRVRGRKRAVKGLGALRTSTASLADAARAGADLDPELVYRTFAYAVHPTWTRGHDFTIAQSIPPETWYLTAADGAGVTVSSSAPAAAPVATVEMSRDAFRKLLREEPVPHGQRPTVHGDRGAVALMHEWTQRARGAH